MFNFGIKNQQAFGLDISGSSVKLLELKRDKKKIFVQASSQVQLPKGVVTNDVVTDAKTFSYLVRQAAEKPLFGRVSSGYAVVSLPESKSFVRVIQIPKMSETEAENAVPFEAENFIPMPLDQVYLDWQKLGEEGEKMNVLIIATPKNYVDSLLGILDSAGIKPVALEVESQSCHRALIPFGSLETSLIVNIGGQHSNIIMVENGSLQFTSTVPIAGAGFTDAIAKTLGVSSAKAQEIKEKVGIGNTVEYPNIKTATAPVLKSLSAEIKNILKFHNEHSQLPVSRILLSGGGSKMKYLTEMLEGEFKDEDFSGLRLELGDPWVNLENPEKHPMDGQESLSFATALGLAIRGLNSF